MLPKKDQNAAALPVYPELTEEMQDSVVEAVTETLTEDV